MEQWFYAVGGQQHGPVSDETLRELIATGKIGIDDLVWQNGMAEWAPAQSIPSLAAQPVSGAYVVRPTRTPEPAAAGRAPEEKKGGATWIMAGAVVLVAIIAALLSSR